MSSAENPDPLSPASKGDPEGFALRGRPRPVTRFRRGLVIGTAGTAAAAFVGLAWFALEPPSFRLAGEKEVPPLASGSTPEGLADAPASYADVPQLGPPLPGDLGRPILEHQRSAGATGGASGEPVSADRQLAGQRRLAEQEAARTSAVLVRLAATPSGAPAHPVAEVAAAGAAAAAPPAPSAPGPQRKVDFLKGAGGSGSQPLVEAPSRWSLSAGTVIAAALLTGLNSDLPGIVLAQVTEPVRDSATGTAVLIPQGARLIGSYDSMVTFGQRRALVAWQRIVFPDGSSMQLDNVPAADAAGFAGLEDRVEFHEGRLLKGIALASLLGVGGELGSGDDPALVRALREAAQQNGARAGEAIVTRNLDVRPTLTVRPGYPVRAIVHRDLVLRPWRG